MTTKTFAGTAPDYSTTFGQDCKDSGHESAKLRFALSPPDFGSNSNSNLEAGSTASLQNRVFSFRESRVSNRGGISGILGWRLRECYPPMPTRRLEDRIRELCARALYETEPAWSVTIHQLQMAIQEHALRVSNASTGAVVTGKPVIVERRQA